MQKNSYDQFFKKAQEVRRPVKPAPKRSRQEITTSSFSSSKSKGNRRGTPWGPIVGMTMALCAGLVYMVEPEIIDNALSKIEITAFGQASASGSEAAEKSKAAPAKQEKSAAAKGDGKHGPSPDGKAAVHEDFSHFEKLKQRKEELDAREKELSELEEELQRQKVELDKRLQQLEEMRAQIGQTLKDRVEVDQEKVNKLVELYSNMKPKQAAEVIGTINEDLAVEVLAKMKKKNAAEVMNLLSPEKSRVLSEKYMGYRRVASEPKGT